MVSGLSFSFLATAAHCRALGAAGKLGVGGQRGKIGRIAQGSAQRLEILLDRGHLAILGSQIEQGRGIASSQASLDTGGNIHALRFLSEGSEGLA